MCRRLWQWVSNRSVRWYLTGLTYNLGFFLGPGLPFSFCFASSDGVGAALFEPVFAPFRDFLFDPSAGTLSSGTGVSPSSGVPTSSAALPATSFSLAAMVGVSTAVEDGFGSKGNRASKSDDRRSNTIFDNFVDLDELLAVGVDTMVEVDIEAG